MMLLSEVIYANWYSNHLVNDAIAERLFRTGVARLPAAVHQSVVVYNAIALAGDALQLAGLAPIPRLLRGTIYLTPLLVYHGLQSTTHNHQLDRRWLLLKVHNHIGQVGQAVGLASALAHIYFGKVVTGGWVTTMLVAQQLQERRLLSDQLSHLADRGRQAAIIGSVVGSLCYGHLPARLFAALQIVSGMSALGGDKSTQQTVNDVVSGRKFTSLVMQQLFDVETLFGTKLDGSLDVKQIDTANGVLLVRDHLTVAPLAEPPGLNALTDWSPLTDFKPTDDAWQKTVENDAKWQDESSKPDQTEWVSTGLAKMVQAAQEAPQGRLARLLAHLTAKLSAMADDCHRPAIQAELGVAGHYCPVGRLREAQAQYDLLRCGNVDQQDLRMQLHRSLAQTRGQLFRKRLNDLFTFNPLKWLLHGFADPSLVENQYVWVRHCGEAIGHPDYLTATSANVRIFILAEEVIAIAAPVVEAVILRDYSDDILYHLNTAINDRNNPHPVPANLVVQWVKDHEIDLNDAYGEEGRLKKRYVKLLAMDMGVLTVSSPATEDNL